MFDSPFPYVLATRAQEKLKQTTLIKLTNTFKSMCIVYINLY